MEILINGRPVDIDEKSRLTISCIMPDIEKEKFGMGLPESISVPATGNNQLIFMVGSDPNSFPRFNDTLHIAEVCEQGCLLLRGEAVVMGFDTEQDRYIFSVARGRTWLDESKKAVIRETEAAFEEKMTAETIIKSWEWDKPVRFLPVDRDRYEEPDLLSGYLQYKNLALEDYHPFINVKGAMTLFFESCEYRVDSKFMEIEFFSSIHISGKYSRKSTRSIIERMDFLARRRDDSSARSDSLGNVYADTGANGIGSIVQTTGEDAFGSGAFNTNNCFRMTGQVASFVPTEEVTAGFEYYLHYTTEYRIKSRTELVGFDTIVLEDGIERTIKLQNKFPDQRDSLKENQNYTLYIFDENPGCTFLFSYEELKAGSWEEKYHMEFEGQNKAVNITTGNQIREPRLYLCRPGEQTYNLYQGDWAIYEYDVYHEGLMDVIVKLRSSARTSRPSSPVYFSNIYFSCGEAGMTFTLRKDSWMRPVFTHYPGYGDTIKFEHVAVYGLHYIDLLKAVSHLFDLVFYTDELSKTVFIEAREVFYDGHCIDLTGKLDLTKPIVYREEGGVSQKDIKYDYIDQDGVVHRWNLENGTTFGQYSRRLAGSTLDNTRHTRINQMFAPSLNTTGTLDQGGSATVIRVGDRDRVVEPVTNDELNFPLTVVRYAGLEALPGSRWGWPSFAAEYPRVNFHSRSAAPVYSGVDDYDGRSLCFEDRDGLRGLNAFYKHKFSLMESGTSIEAYLHLSPADMEGFLYPDPLRKDFRALYNLKINGEDVKARLIRIEDYHTDSPDSTKCIFIKEN